MLGVSCPILPLKSYTFDMPSQSSDRYAFVFEDKNFTTSHLSSG